MGVLLGLLLLQLASGGVVYKAASGQVLGLQGQSVHCCVQDLTYQLLLTCELQCCCCCCCHCYCYCCCGSWCL